MQIPAPREFIIPEDLLMAVLQIVGQAPAAVASEVYLRLKKLEQFESTESDNS